MIVKHTVWNDKITRRHADKIDRTGNFQRIVTFLDSENRMSTKKKRLNKLYGLLIHTLQVHHGVVQWSY